MKPEHPPLGCVGSLWLHTEGSSNPDSAQVHWARTRKSDLSFIIFCLQGSVWWMLSSCALILLRRVMNIDFWKWQPHIHFYYLKVRMCFLASSLQSPDSFIWCNPSKSQNTRVRISSLTGPWVTTLGGLPVKQAFCIYFVIAFSHFFPPPSFTPKESWPRDFHF